MEKSNKFLNGPYAGKMPTTTEIVLAPILFLLVMPIGFMIASIIGGAIYNSLGSSLGRAVSYIYYLQLALGFGLCILVLFLFVTKTNRRGIETLGLYKEKAVSYYIKGFFVPVIGVSGIVLILQWTGSITLTFSPESFQIGGMLLIPLILIGWIIQAGAEELLLRGYMLQTITVKSDLFKGIIISSVVFACLHIGNNGVTIVSMMNILLCGVALSLLCIHQESIWGACGFHAAWNLMQGNVFGISVSGSSTQESLWLAQSEVATVWNGGIFGIEGSLLTTIFFILMITVLVVWINRANQIIQK
ncbi:MAG: lysostaphin resistance A-like protein [Cellulosilyticaceae bacterium]